MPHIFYLRCNFIFVKVFTAGDIITAFVLISGIKSYRGWIDKPVSFMIWTITITKKFFDKISFIVFMEKFVFNFLKHAITSLSKDAVKPLALATGSVKNIHTG